MEGIPLLCPGLSHFLQVRVKTVLFGEICHVGVHTVYLLVETDSLGAESGSVHGQSDRLKT